jgi:hypothetical protein
MKPRTALILCLVMLCICGLDARAQRRKDSAVPLAPRPPQPTWSILTEHFPEDGAGTTTVKLEPLPLETATPKQAQAFITASFTYEDRPTALPKYVALTILSRADVCRFGAQADLQLLLDGKLLTLTYQPESARGEGVWWIAQETEGGGCAESLGAFITPGTFGQVAAAKTASARIGQTSFSFSDTNLNALRDLARRLPAPGAR